MEVKITAVEHLHYLSSKGVLNMIKKRKSPKVYDFGPLRIDQAKREVIIHENIVELEPREFDILWLLVTHSNEALPCDFLHNALWNHPDPEHGEQEVILHVQRLQKKLQLERFHIPYLISSVETERGKGYQFSEI